MSSSRLYGKVLKKIHDKTCLEHLCNRLKQSQYYKKIVIATSINIEDVAVQNEAERVGVFSYRGSLEDVLDRITKAADEYNVDPVVLIGGDRAIQDVNILDYVIDRYEDEYPLYECAVNINFNKKTNSYEYTFPKGQVVYVISRKFLAKVNAQKWDITSREELHKILFAKKKVCNLLNVEAPPGWNRPDIKTAIDTLEDFEFNKILFDNLYQLNPFFTIDDVIAFVDKNRIC